LRGLLQNHETEVSNVHVSTAFNLAIYCGKQRFPLHLHAFIAKKSSIHHHIWNRELLLQQTSGFAIELAELQEYIPLWLASFRLLKPYTIDSI
jgi:hypothetical protein